MSRASCPAETAGWRLRPITRWTIDPRASPWAFKQGKVKAGQQWDPGCHAMHIVPGRQTSAGSAWRRHRPFTETLDAHNSWHRGHAETHLSEWHPACSEVAASFQGAAGARQDGVFTGRADNLPVSPVPQEAPLCCQASSLAQRLVIATPVATCSQNRLDLPWNGEASASNQVLMPTGQVAVQQASDEVRRITQGIKMFL